jgi:hypothetical protein
MRVPVEGGYLWFKTCSPVQAFEPRLTASLFARWPDRVSEVIAWDERFSWLLLADAGTPVRVFGNPPEAWLDLLPKYAELQRDEAVHANDHVAHGVPDLRPALWPVRFASLLRLDLPLETAEIESLRRFGPRFDDLCRELAEYAVPETIQHDDLHMGNVYANRGQPRVLDWGDSSVSHPFVSLVVTFRFLEEVNRLAPDDRWFHRLRDAYLEPWGSGFETAFHVALRVGAFVHAFSWARQRGYLTGTALTDFDQGFAIILRRAVARVLI